MTSKVPALLTFLTNTRTLLRSSFVLTLISRRALPIFCFVRLDIRIDFKRTLLILSSQKPLVDIHLPFEVILQPHRESSTKKTCACVLRPVGSTTERSRCFTLLALVRASARAQRLFVCNASAVCRLGATQHTPARTTPT